MAVPRISGITPNSGPPGTSVTLAGTGFSGTTSVVFGGVFATFFADSDSRVTATAPPPNVSGAVDVIVTTGDGTSAKGPAGLFTYTAPIPVVTSVDPTHGVSETNVFIKGSGFIGVGAVNFGNSAGGLATVISDTLIGVMAPPPVQSGAVHITVGGPGGTSATSNADLFVYDGVCVDTFNVPTARGGCVIETPGTRHKGGERFRMEIDFASTPAGCICKCGEYRQYVRGTATINGRAATHLLPNPLGGAPIRMLPRPGPGDTDDNFREDGVANATAPTNAHYGHRDEGTGDTTDQYPGDRANGCRYRGSDFPGVSGGAGVTFSIDFDFRGAAIDRCNHDAVVQQNDWTVTCAGTL